MTAAAPADTPLRRIARLATGLILATFTPFTMLPATPWLVVWFVEGVPSFQLLFAVAIALTPLPGLALLQLQEVPRRTVLLALGLLVLALLVAPALMAVPGWAVTVRSLALGAILSTIALSLLLPARAPVSAGST